LKLGDEVKGGEALGVVYCADESAANEAVQRIRNAYKVSAEPPAEVEPLVKEIVNE
jgi:thymidine phosphorylase